MPIGLQRSEESDTALKKTDSSSTKRPASGIRTRVLMYFSFFVAFIILLLWLFQIVFLDDFYRDFKSRQIEDAANAIVQNLSLDADELSSISADIAEHYDVCILLLDADSNVLLSAEGTRNCLIHRLSERALAWWCNKASEDGAVTTELFRMHSVPSGPAGSLVEVEPRNRTNSPLAEPSYTPDIRSENKNTRRRLYSDDMEIQSMLYARKLQMPNGSSATLLLNSQINPIASTVSALRSQLTVITLIVVLLAILLAIMISHQISNPIIETNAAARELAHARYTKPAHSNSYREIAELNDTLVKASEELGQVEKLQHELIANISHDLRTPLTMIGGYAEAMRDLPSENTPENMQIIIDETTRLSTLVNELLDFSRMQTGSVQLTPSRFCLTDAVDSMIRRVGKLTEKDGYTIQFEYDSKLYVKADSTRIGQVIYNLIGNALTYTGPDKRVIVRQSVQNTNAHIDITDTGSGIAPDEIDLIWNRYYRTKETHKRAVIGSGLGLNIVQTILERHQVPYGVRSEVGHGTTFWFELPLSPSSDDEPSSSDPC